MSSIALRRTGEGWEFSTEAAVEDFVWDNLQELLGLTASKSLDKVTHIWINLDKPNSIYSFYEFSFVSPTM